MFPEGRELVLGVSGGISAYKSCDLVRRLRESGFLVTVIPTQNSLNFVGTATWEALSGRPVATDLWNNIHDVAHIKLAKQATAIVIAPATANLLAKLAHGLADDLLTNVVLATTSPIFLVPAMHTEMWNNSATQANLQTLRERGFHIIDPDVGRLTGSDVGVGRYPETSKILQALKDSLGFSSDLIGRKVLISAGGTREAIDPVRYLGNASSGKQGYALAHAALSRGADVVLVSANSDLPDIEGVKTIKVTSALQMQEAIDKEFDDSDIVILSAAVADARPKLISEKKIDKSQLHTIELVTNPDIAAGLGSRKKGQILVGFAAQTSGDEEGLGKAKEKLQQKNLDIIYFNNVADGAIFGADLTEGVIISKAHGTDTQTFAFESSSKLTLAHKLLDLALDKLGLDNE